MAADSVQTAESALVQVFGHGKLRREQVYVCNSVTTQQAADDLTQLSWLGEPNLLAALETRYGQDQIYSDMAGVLIAVNPHKTIANLYGPELVRAYSLQLARQPHVYRVATQAKRYLARSNQTVVCCGLSGSGKTVSAKRILECLCSAETSSNFADRLLATNPVLEAFGNASTLLNHNSSRFAKFLKVHWADSQEPPVKATTETYLLETSRVTHVPAGERNFHCFYQTLAGCNKSWVQPLDHFRLVQHTAGRPTDAADFKAVAQALTRLGVSQDDQTRTWDALGGLLYLGNLVDAVDADSTDPVQTTPAMATLVSTAAGLLRVPVPALTALLTVRTLKVGRETIHSPYSGHNFRVNLESCIRFLYGAVFQYLVQEINACLVGQGNLTSNPRWIGLLDVFGFECFETNSFEQFCINYANERLQLLFNERILAGEQREYQKEGLSWVPLKLQDNTSTLQLLAGKPSGLFSMLDSTCVMPKGTADAFLANLHTVHQKHGSLGPVRLAGFQSRRRRGFNAAHPGTFQVHHYAASVEYTVTDFLAKNRDAISPEVDALVQQHLPHLVNRSTAPTKKGRFRSVGRVFTQQLAKLAQTLEETQIHFVRCLNPNGAQAPGRFDWSCVQPQVKYGGLIETLRMLKFGYPFRLPYSQLVTGLELQKQGQWIEVQTCQPWVIRNFCEALAKEFGATGQGYQLGLTKIFFRRGQTDLLDWVEGLRGTRWRTEPAVYRNIQTWLKKRRRVRLCRSVQAVAKWRIRLRRLRAVNRFRRAVRVTHRLLQFTSRLLEKVRSAKLVQQPQPTKPTKPLDPELSNATRDLQAKTRALEAETRILQAEKQQLLVSAQQAAQAREAAFVRQERDLHAKDEELAALAKQEAQVTQALEAKTLEVEQHLVEKQTLLSKQAKLEQLVQARETAYQAELEAKEALRSSLALWEQKTQGLLHQISTQQTRQVQDHQSSQQILVRLQKALARKDRQIASLQQALKDQAADHARALGLADQ